MQFHAVHICEKRRDALRMIWQKEGMKEWVNKENILEKFEDTKGRTKTRKSKKNR